MLSCLASLTSTSESVDSSGTEIDFSLTGPNEQLLTNSSRRKFSEVTFNETTGVYSVDVTFPSISRSKDEGNYRCTAVARPTNSSIQEFVMNGVNSTILSLSIIGELIYVLHVSLL